MTFPRLMLVLDLGRLNLAITAPGVLVQVRDRAATARQLCAALRALREAGVHAVVNDRADVARASGAAGVHLPETGLPVADARRIVGAGALVGVSMHAGSAAERAAGADYAVFGPVFATPGKGTGVGLGELAAAVRRLPCPVLAIGGIDAGNARSVLDAGVAGVAVLRAAGRAAEILEVVA